MPQGDPHCDLVRKRETRQQVGMRAEVQLGEHLVLGERLDAPLRTRGRQAVDGQSVLIGVNVPVRRVSA